MPSRVEREGISAASASEAMTGKKEADAIAHSAVITKDVDDLRDAVVILAGRVSSLSEALTAVNEIQLRQTATERATKAVQEKADATQQQTANLAASIVPREEHERKETERLERENRARKEAVIRLYQTVGLVVLAGVIALLGLLNYEQSQSSAAYRVCILRNIQNHKVLEVLSTRDPTAPPLTSLQQANLKKLQDAFNTVNCGNFR